MQTFPSVKLRQTKTTILSVGINDSARLGRLDGKQYTSKEEFTTELDRLLDVASKLCLCDRHEIPYLDIFDLWMARGEEWSRSQLFSDGLHLNSQGYQNLLEDIQNWDAIQMERSIYNY